MKRPMHRLTVAQYHTLRATGVLVPDDEVELLRGYLVLKYPRSPEHYAACVATRSALAALLPDETVRVRCRLTLTDSEPDPDVLVVRPGGTAGERVGAGQVSLVIEVADRDLEVARLDKVYMYARDGVPVYWIVNVVDGQVEVYEQPTGTSPSPTYGTQRLFRPGDAVPVVLDGATVGTIPVADLLP
jgi:Uma2 family endonuclease